MARDPSSKVRVAAVGDLHCREDEPGRFRLLVKQVNERADLLLLCGDLTDHGLATEGQVVAEELSGLRIPCVAVLGNHDYDTGAAQAIRESLSKIGIRCLDGDRYTFDNVLGVAGVKGFGGGFGTATVQAFGEREVKSFVQEAVNESLKLETALGQLGTPKKVVILHYSPIAETTEGEDPEVRPFLGTSRLLSPINRYGADAVFHGHAHHGRLTAKTDRGVPVYNVALPLLKQHTPEQRFALVEI
jgi:Icc-related predicted phosphoesterase